MREKVIEAVVENDPTVLTRAVDEMFPFTDACVSYWGLVNALYGGVPFTSRQLHHVGSCEHCSGRVARMLDRECPSPSLIKAALTQNQSALSKLVEHHSMGARCVRCTLWNTGLRLMMTGFRLPLPRLALGVSFAPASKATFQPTGRQKLDESTEAVVTVENEELLVHVDSTRAGDVRLVLVPEFLEEDSPPLQSATLTLRRISENDWTGTHNFGSVSALRTQWSKLALAAEIDRENA